MQAYKQKNLLGYYVTVLLAMCMNILPLPVFFKNLNPDWVLLVLIYWVLTVPQRIGVLNAWVVGVLLDILTGRMLGQNALAYSLIIYISLRLHKRLSNYLIPQQTLFIFFCLFFSRIMAFWIGNLHGHMAFFHVFLLPVFVGALLWPLLCYVLGYLFGFRRFG